MKRGISILVVVALLATLCSGCGAPGPSGSDTWNSTRIAPFPYLVAFEATDSFERTYNRLYAGAVDHVVDLSDQLVRDAESAGGRADTLQTSVFELIGLLLDDHLLDDARSVALLQGIAARRAYRDAAYQRLGEVRKATGATDYAKAVLRAASVYFAQVYAQSVRESAVTLLDVACFAPQVSGANLPKAVKDKADAVRTAFARDLQGRLDGLDVDMDLVNLSIASIDSATVSRYDYCVASSLSVLADTTAWVAVYKAAPDGDAVLAARAESDLAAFRALVGNSPGITTGASPGASSEDALAALRQAAAYRFAKSSVVATDLVATSQDTAPAAAEAFKTDPTAFTRDTASQAVPAGVRQPSPVLAAQLERLYGFLSAPSTALPAPSSGTTAATAVWFSLSASPTVTPAPTGAPVDGVSAKTPAENDAQNAARTLETIRKYQQTIKKYLKASEQKTLTDKVVGFVSNLVASAVDVDTVLALLSQPVDALLVGRKDEKVLKTYLDDDLKKYIRTAIGSDWQSCVLDLAEVDAQVLVDNFKDWFKNTKHQTDFLFTQDEIRQLLRTIGQKRTPAAVQLVVPTPVPQPTGAATPPGPDVTQGPDATTAPRGKDIFTIQLSIQEVAALKWDTPAEKLLQEVFGWTATYGDAADDKAYGWHMDSTGTYRSRYTDPAYELFVSEDGNGHVWSLGTKITADPATNAVHCLLSFDNEGNVNACEDFVLYTFGSSAAAGGTDVWVESFLGVQYRASGTGRRYSYWYNGKPQTEFGYDGSTAYVKRYDHDTGALLRSGILGEVDPDGYQGGKYTATLAVPKKFDPEQYVLYALDGVYTQYTADGTLQVRAQFVDGITDGIAEYFFPNGKVHFSITLKKDVRNGPFKVYWQSEDKSIYYLEAEGEYKDGFYEGLWKYYRPGVILMTTATYKAGRLEGPCAGYGETGVLAISGYNREGNPSEDWQLYNADGTAAGKGPRLDAHVWTHEVDPFFVVIYTDFE